ncbi:hypothetical protein D3C78_1401500 [compost metagenome]
MLRQQRDAFQVGTFEFATTILINHQSAGDTAQIGAWFAQGAGLTGFEQTYEGVLRQICCVIATPNASDQPAV